jgi:polyisoprenyl-phosphate glycosyltransferase
LPGGTGGVLGMTGSNGDRPALLSVVVPTFCEQECIGETHRRLTDVLSTLGEDLTYELVFVDDGSTDDTFTILKEIAAQDPCLRVVRFSRNFGHQIAMTAGLDSARGDAVVVIAADLQDPPEVIREFVEKWRAGYKVVYGQRRRRKGEGWFKRATASIFYRWLQRVSDTELPVDSGDFRLMDRQVVDALAELRETGRYMRGMISWVGFTQCAVLYDRDPRYAGTTKYPLGAMLRFAMDGVTSFSSRPLIISAQFGFLITVGALIGSAWVLVGRLLNPASTTSGWTSILLVVLFLGGVQLMSIGLLGAYLARVFVESKRRPLYVVAEALDHAEGECPEERA